MAKRKTEIYGNIDIFHILFYNMYIKIYLRKKCINIKKTFKIILMIIITIIIVCIFINFGIILKERKKIINSKNAFGECALILGCGVRPDGTPSDMLRDRLITGINLYKDGKIKKLIMSGDHGRKNYDEVNVMKQFAVSLGVPSEDIFMDHAGFCTYDSVCRAKEIFMADSIIIVSQKYHLYRALYIADMLGISAKGVPADLHSYPGQEVRSTREILARVKDFFTSIFKPDPKYLGEAIPVSGNGDITNDK